MSEGHKTALLQIELALTVDESLVGVDTDYLGKKHCMRAKKLFLCYLAFQAERTFFDKWRSYFLSWNGMKVT